MREDPACFAVNYGGLSHAEELVIQKCDKSGFERLGALCQLHQPLPRQALISGLRRYVR